MFSPPWSLWPVPALTSTTTQTPTARTGSARRTLGKTGATRVLPLPTARIAPSPFRRPRGIWSSSMTTTTLVPSTGGLMANAGAPLARSSPTSFLGNLWLRAGLA
ncbi:hypothetical protein B0T10DRAFT_601998 [Thelonectria olida]|uniref:Uncharacterized protein n=1 Tax=Thelonectria olida TaxID=1576542 RepID=A0A9P8WFI6_9HYPO|nr:hypothetical protein B0T10DRAFT_601998 [Thelonectria olida]